MNGFSKTTSNNKFIDGHYTFDLTLFDNMLFLGNWQQTFQLPLVLLDFA